MKKRVIVLFLLVLAAATASSFAAQPFRLFEIAVIRFITDTSGQTILDRGALSATGEFRHDTYTQLAQGVVIPAEAMNRNLLPYSFFPAYLTLGHDALANFNLSSSITIDGGAYFVAVPAENPKLDVGQFVNISTRGNLAPGSEPLIGGFVIEDHPCRVLIRGVGPTLSTLNVATPLADPAIKLFRQSSGIATNNDWAQQSNVAEIEGAAAAVGAFPLPRNSKDAALLVELQPGVYTAHLSSADGAGGTALLEIYKLP